MVSEGSAVDPDPLVDASVGGDGEVGVIGSFDERSDTFSAESDDAFLDLSASGDVKGAGGLVQEDRKPEHVSVGGSHDELLFDVVSRVEDSMRIGLVERYEGEEGDGLDLGEVRLFGEQIDLNGVCSVDSDGEKHQEAFASDDNDSSAGRSLQEGYFSIEIGNELGGRNRLDFVHFELVLLIVSDD